MSLPSLWGKAILSVDVQQRIYLQLVFHFPFPSTNLCVPFFAFSVSSAQLILLSPACGACAVLGSNPNLPPCESRIT
jgi:hypothetical protein